MVPSSSVFTSPTLATAGLKMGLLSIVAHLEDFLLLVGSGLHGAVTPQLVHLLVLEYEVNS